MASVKLKADLGEIMCTVNEISNRYTLSLNNLKDKLQIAFDDLDKFAEKYQKERGKRETALNSKNLANTLQSIDEDEVESSQKVVEEPKNVDVEKKRLSNKRGKQEVESSQKVVEEPKNVDGEKKRLSNKRGKQEVEGMSSPEHEKRQKRNASVKAQSNISKQDSQPLKTLNENVIHLTDENEAVNVSLTQKLRREDNTEKSTRRRKDDDKENAQPVIVQVKQEKISLPPEPMEMEAVLEIPIKQENNKDDIAMPPPAAPVSKSRKAVQKDKSTDSEEEQTGTRRTRTRKQTETTMPPPVPAPERGRAVRASRRATKLTEPTDATDPKPPTEPPAPEPRPKRTRAKKKTPDTTTEVDETIPPQINGIVTPEKPRPKRTRRGKAAEKEELSKPVEAHTEPEIIKPKEERISQPEIETTSPTIPLKTVKNKKATEETISNDSKTNSKAKSGKLKKQEAISLEETQVLCPMNVTVTVEKTFVLPNGGLDHTDGKKAIAMNETVVLDTMNRETMILENPQAARMDATVVLEKGAVLKEGTPNITDDMSILTDDNSDAQEFNTPPQNDTAPQPTSAVKAKVQQFEEMAARTTRTKTRAMAKKDAETENCTPPDKVISKQVLSADTLTKMNNLIFNGKTTQISVSATKPTSKPPPTKVLPASASKLSAISKARDELERGKDDARRKKEAMLEAKREQQRRKREEKMAAAAAAREAAERERRAAVQAAAKERMEKQAHMDQGKLEKLKEVEKKKQELARKVAETERRRAEEQARQAKLADEQKRAEAARKKQLEDSEAARREQLMMAKEIEKRQKEYLEKQKMKQRLEDKMHTPLKNFGTPSGKHVPAIDPVYMADGFQYLNSDEDDDGAPKFPVPTWSMTKARNRQLAIQNLLPTSTVDRFFSVRVHSPDLRAIFPTLERRELKRTSSAVWHTPPALQLSRVQESPI